MSKDWTKVYLRQEDGQEEICIAIEISRELEHKMNEIRGLNPEKWENKDWDLLREAELEINNKKISDKEAKKDSFEAFIKEIEDRVAKRRKQIKIKEY